MENNNLVPLENNEQPGPVAPGPVEPPVQDTRKRALKTSNDDNNYKRQRPNVGGKRRSRRYKKSYKKSRKSYKKSKKYRR